MWWSTFLLTVCEVLTVMMLKMDLWKLGFLMMQCRKNRVPLDSDLMQFVGEIGEAVAATHSGQVILKLHPLYFKMIHSHFSALSGIPTPLHLL